MNSSPRMLLGLAILASLPIAGIARADTTDSGTAALKAEVDALKKEMSEVRRALEELRQAVSQRPAPQPPKPVPPAKVSVTGAPAMGKAEALVTVVEFSDYQCPFCRRHHDATLPLLKKEYVDTGKVRYVYRDFPIDRIHPQAGKAAEAARCAGEQGKYWEMHDAVFANQGQLGVEQLKARGASIGLDQASFDACLDQGKYTAAVREDEAAGRKAGVTGTPTFFVGRTTADGTIEGVRVVGAQPVDAFRQLIDSKLSGDPD